MDFTEPKVYKTLKPTPDSAGYDIVTLPEKSTIYRADASGKKPPAVPKDDEVIPIFFSDKISITPYTGGNPATISSYTTKEKLTLFVLSYKNICKLGVSHKGIEGFVSTCYLGEGIDQSKKPFLFLKPTTPLEPGNPRKYANRIFAEIVCSKGYDGWIALPGTLEQRNLHPKYMGNVALFQEHNSKGAIEYVINPYAPEIVVCNWKDTMVYKGGKRRKMTRRYCKKTSCRKMGFTQKASCRPYKNCYKNKK